MSAGLVDETVAHLSPPKRRCIADLENLAWTLTATPMAPEIGAEAAHSYNRIIGVTGDRSGRAIMKALVKRAKQSSAFWKAMQPMNWRSKMAVWSAYLPVPPPAPAGPLLIRARAVIWQPAVLVIFMR